ncbi:hypothetical protein DL95DRAFT_406944 [Leptodontidium sp. 2 PMI_412]|nr:hypothetical protein DL95DRAFT_406944 [Leptodontidium sp. 2 PMI_412]
MASLRKTQNMQNDNPTTRLLYAILSQKCLKDRDNTPAIQSINSFIHKTSSEETRLTHPPSNQQIDWNAVANNPILKLENITNGHAARMRYSRFKKQMDALNGIIPPPATPRKPRKNRVEKTRSPKREKRVGGGGSGSGSGVKTEYEHEMGRDEKGIGKGKERERGYERDVKSEYGIREGTGESLFSASASTSGSFMGDRDLDRETRDLEGGLTHLPSPAVSLAQHELSSGFGINHGHGHGHGQGHAEQLHFQPTIQIKKERKPSANTLHSRLYGNSHSSHTQAHSHSHSHHTSPLRAPNHLPSGSMADFQNHQHRQQVPSSVSTSTFPSTPRMCIEDLETEHERGYSPDNSPPSHSHSQYQRHLDAENVNEQDSFGLASLDNSDLDMDMDELMHSFGMVGDHSHGQGHGHLDTHGHGQGHAQGGSAHGMYSPLMSESAFPFGMSSPGVGGLGASGSASAGMGIGGYDAFWSQGHNHSHHAGGVMGSPGESERMRDVATGSGGAVVKKEERWEEGYRRV